MNKLLLSLPFALMIISTTPHVFGAYEDTIVVLETDLGRLIIEFFPDSAPNHVENFVTLSEDGFYTGTVFHRIIEGFMIQSGDPNSKDPNMKSQWGTGSPGYTIDSEFNNIEHKRGIVSMARSNDPNSAGSQFFIVHKDSNFLDGQYTVFGRILTDESFETLDRIATMQTSPNDQPIQPSQATLKDVKVLNRSELDNLPEYIIPETTDETTFETPATSVRNDLPEYGISFTSPAGWFVQTPDPTSSQSPDIVIVGPSSSNSNPAVSISINRSMYSLERHVEDLRKTFTPLINSGVLSIVSESTTVIHEKNAYVINAIGHFEDKKGIEQKIGFSTILLKTDEDMHYNLQYSNNLENFEKNIDSFTDIVNSIEFSSMDFTKIPAGASSDTEGYDGTLQENNEEGGGCLIATAAFGSEMAPQVQFLREIRDSTVMSTQSGTAFMTGFNQIYYSFSPQIADYERENPVFKEAVKVTLTPMLTSLTLLNHVNVDTEEEMLGYGIGIILLNIGMYFVAPAAAIIVIKNRIR